MRATMLTTLKWRSVGSSTATIDMPPHISVLHHMHAWNVPAHDNACLERKHATGVCT
jgi:hypothetical protein